MLPVKRGRFDPEQCRAESPWPEQFHPGGALATDSNGHGALATDSNGQEALATRKRWIFAVSVNPSRVIRGMPYLTTDDLPDAVRHHLPPHAQQIYLAAFNSAWKSHAQEPDGETTVHRIAWSAVKRSYRKDGDTWVSIRD